ncbi:prostatic spermine-binding protein-like [Neltuma alba]|uniref:prostatic spermine-binding protein-like n=1 Tax=Neltuma alba TaxID=207710 RepID=UPI0010A5413C|nr:prostatic spermine-binding protein-like [Prosopis alba]
MQDHTEKEESHVIKDSRATSWQRSDKKEPPRKMASGGEDNIVIEEESIEEETLEQKHRRLLNKEDIIEDIVRLNDFDENELEFHDLDLELNSNIDDGRLEENNDNDIVVVENKVAANENGRDKGKGKVAMDFGEEDDRDKERSEEDDSDDWDKDSSKEDDGDDRDKEMSEEDDSDERDKEMSEEDDSDDASYEALSASEDTKETVFEDFEVYEVCIENGSDYDEDELGLESDNGPPL